MAGKSAIHRALDGAFARAPIRPFALESARYVLLSDQHKGQRDHADDFRASERSYLAALDHYLAAGFTLVVLGDGEELWECRPKRAVPAYQNVLAVERRFHDAGRYFKIFGNHDDLWMHQDAVDRYLGPRLGPLAVLEALRFEVTDGGARLGDLFLAHGHQGTFASDRIAGISRFFVRNVWRPAQRFFKLSLTTPARDECLREKHDIAMYDWAAGRGGVVLIAGHTHRPIWTSQTHVEQLREELARLRQEAPGDAPRIADLERRIAERLAKDHYCEAEHQRRALKPLPCYFNSGCCCFKDGNITGIELEAGRIRLVRWAGATREVRREAPVRDVFAALQRETGKGKGET